MSKASALIKKITDALSPEFPVGGLEIADAFLRSVVSRDDQLKPAYTRLMPGVIQDGVISDRERFLASLKELRAQLGDLSHPMSVIATLRSGGIYTQSFSLPPLPKDRLVEAVELNLLAISPLERGADYHDAAAIGEGATGEAEFLGAFAPRKLIDDLKAVLDATGFSVLAFEFGALSIARTVRELGGYGAEVSRLAINVMSDGVDFMILRHGQLAFHYWSSWDSLIASDGKRQINLADFNGLLSREVQRLTQFYAGKWGGSITNALLIAADFPEESSRLLAESFLLKVETLSLRRFGTLGTQWLGALGAALRGAMPRSADVFISLSPVGTEEEYARNRLRHFLLLWRNIVISSSIFLAAVFLVGVGLLATEERRIASDAVKSISPELLEESARLEAEAKGFNHLLSLALAAKRETTPLAGLLADLRRLAEGRVTLSGVSVDATSGSMRLTGRAPSEVVAIGFKNLLAGNPKFQDISLPFANIQAQSDGSVIFQLTLAFK